MSKKVGVGVVGYGFVGKGAHVPAVAEIPDAELVAVADANEAALAKAAKKWNPKSVYKDYNELIKDPAVQAVIVSVPTPAHYTVAMAAIKAGKHVLCEMPLAVKVSDAEKLCDAAKKKGVVLMPSLTFRFTTHYVKAKELLKQGKLGKPTFAMYREFIPAQDLARQWPVGSWTQKMEESGGPLFTLAVWSIDLLRWLLDTDIASVQANTTYTSLKRFGGTIGYDSAATLRMANGVTACLQYSATVCESAASSALEVIGDSTCALNASSFDTLTLYGDETFKTEWKYKGAGARMWGHYQQDEHFVQCLKKGKTPSVKPEDGLKAMVVAQKIATAT